MILEVPVDEIQLLTIELVYLGGRFLVGAGNSLASMASPVLLTEICHPQHRAKVTALYNCMYEVGYICKSFASRPFFTISLPS